MQSTEKGLEPKRYVLLGTSDCIDKLRVDIDAAGRSDAKVLLTGETGVGKEVVAHEIHRHSRRNKAPFITINCAGVPDTLLESELFGHARGSFTGAFRDNPGLLRQAHGGTVFLDEVGEMSLRMQALFLRFLESGEIQTVGAPGLQTRVDARIITATNRNLPESVASSEFREDLYYRLNVFHLHIAPLRERPGDVVQLLNHYGQIFAEQQHRPAPSFSPAALEMLIAYGWPGNIRELRNVVERIISRVTASIVEPSHLPAEIVAAVSHTAATPAIAGEALSHKAKVEALLERINAHKESFWTVVYPLFMSRDITRDDLRYIIRVGLEQSHGSYRVLLGQFNMAAADYKRFLGFLKQHDCHLPFQRFRMLSAMPTDGRRASRAGA